MIRMLLLIASLLMLSIPAYGNEWRAFSVTGGQDEYGNSTTVGKGIATKSASALVDLGLVSLAFFPDGEVSLILESASTPAWCPKTIWPDKQIVQADVQWRDSKGEHTAALSFDVKVDRLVAHRGDMLRDMFRRATGDVTFHIAGKDREGYKIDPLEFSARGCSREAAVIGLKLENAVLDDIIGKH